MEDIARKAAQKIIGEQIQASGLIVDPIIVYLAASPGIVTKFNFWYVIWIQYIVYTFNFSNIFLDGLVGNNAVVEKIKCPFAAQNTVSAVDAVEKKLVR